MGWAPTITAPNNPPNTCSVLDPNCKKAGPIKQYGEFLTCEGGTAIGTLDSPPEPEERAAEPYTFSVVNSAPFVFAARGQEGRALVAGGVAAVYDISLALYIRETCVQQVYGPGYF